MSRPLDLFKRVDEAKIERRLGEFRRNPRTLASHILAIGQHSESERLPSVMVESPVDLDPESETFGQLKSIVGFTDLGDWIL